MHQYILTYSKTKFYPLEPVESDILIEDIAHALAQMTRANGHFIHFYSVGQHSINCFKEAKARGYTKEVQLGCLLHDASEAYLSDITRPVKAFLPTYKEIEKNLQTAIYKKYKLELDDNDYVKIKEVDDDMLYHEFKNLMGVDMYEKEPLVLSQPDFSLRDISSVEKEFLDLFFQIIN